jgi:hypothetical protein
MTVFVLCLGCVVLTLLRYRAAERWALRQGAPR